MKRIVYAMFALVVTLLPVATKAADMVITSPSNGSTVSRTFSLSGSGTPAAQFSVAVDGKSYVPITYRSQQGGEYPSGGTINADGHFSLPVDLNGEHVVSDGNGFSAVPTGTHTVTVQEFFYGGQTGTPGHAQVTLTGNHSFTTGGTQNFYKGFQHLSGVVCDRPSHLGNAFREHHAPI